MENRSIALVDSNFRRRAALSHALSDSGIHVEPFEDITEITHRWPHSGCLLVEDQGNQIPRLLDHMTDRGSWLPLIALSEAPATGRVVKAILAGAIDYLPWPCEPSRILAVIDAAEDNGSALGTLKLREARARGRIQKLTKREREVLAGVAGGLSNRLIGERLAISPRTVEIHRANMLHKMGAAHTSEAIRIAIEAAVA